MVQQIICAESKKEVFRQSESGFHGRAINFQSVNIVQRTPPDVEEGERVMFIFLMARNNLRLISLRGSRSRPLEGLINIDIDPLIERFHVQVHFPAPVPSFNGDNDRN